MSYLVILPNKLPIKSKSQHLYLSLLNNLKNKLIKDTIWLLISQSTLIFSGVIQFVIISHYFSVEGLGFYTQAFAFFTIFSSIANWGLAGLTIKHSAEVDANHSLISVMLYSALFLSLILSLGALIIIIVLCFYYPELFSNKIVARLIVIFCLAIPFYNVNRILFSFLQGKRAMKKLSLYKTVKSLLILALLYGFSKLFQNIYIAVSIYAIAELLAYFYLIFDLKRELIHFFSKFWVMNLFINGFKNFVVDIISYAQDRIDHIILGYLLTSYEIGIYSFVTTASRSLLLISSVFMQNFDPIIAKLWYRANWIEVSEFFEKFKKVSFFVMTPIVLFSFIFYYFLVSYVLLDFSDSMYFYFILTIGVYFFSLISWSGGVFVMCGLFKENIFRTLLILISGITLNIIGGTYGGLWGAFTAASVQMFIIVRIQQYFIKKYFKINILAIQK